MGKLDYIAKTDEGMASQFERFRDAIANYTTTLGLTPAAVTAQASDATYFRHILNHARTMQNVAAQWTSYKTNLLTAADPTDTKPATPDEATPPPAMVAPGILPRFRELVAQIKAAASYTEAMGTALGIVGPNQAPQDITVLAPNISLRTSGGQVEVVWNKSGMEAVEIQKDTGSGWQFLATDTRPNYIDTTPAPSPAAKWKFRAIYTRDAQRIGQWSNIAKITVGG